MSCFSTFCFSRLPLLYLALPLIPPHSSSEELYAELGLLVFLLVWYVWGPPGLYAFDTKPYGQVICISDVVPLAKRPLVQALFGALMGVASVTGPLIGGGFTSNVTWR